MSWPEGIAYAVVVLGLLAGGYIAAQRPAFWAEFGVRIAAVLLPALTRYVSKRMTPDEERAFQQCVRRGGEWDHMRKRCRD